MALLLLTWLFRFIIWQVLKSGSKQQRVDVLGRFARSYYDDGLKKLSAAEYIDVRVDGKLREFERRAPRLGSRVMAIKIGMLFCTSASTILGAQGLANWIPVAMLIYTIGFITWQLLKGGSTWLF